MSEPVPPTNRTDSNHQQPEGFNRILAWLFLVFSTLLIIFAVYFVLSVAVPLTRPSAYFEKLSQRYLEQLNAQSDAEPQVDQLTVDLTVMLEYVNADIRTAGAQVAIALVAGLLFTTIGVLLLAAGISGHLDFGGSIQGADFRLVTAAPGLVAVLIGGFIIFVGVNKDVRRPMDASIKRPVGTEIDTSLVDPTVAKKGEGVAKDQKIED